MPHDKAPRRRLLIALSVVLALAVVSVCCVQVAPFVRAAVTVLLLPTSRVAPPACAHETSPAPQTPLQESLFATVTSSVTSSTASFMGRSPVTDDNVALCVVRSRDGAIVGHYALESKAAVAGLVQAGGVLYVLQPYFPDVQHAQVCAMRASDGTRVWCQTSPATYLPLILSGSTLYIQGAAVLTALRASDGAILWTHPFHRGDDEATKFVQIAVESDSVYLPTAVNQVCALRVTDGATRWCTAPGVFTQVSRLAADTTGAYVLDQARIVALRSTDGATLWQRSLQRPTTDAPSSFLLQSGLLYVTTFHSADDTREVLTAVRASDGTTQWQTTTNQSLVVTVQGNVAYLADTSSLQAVDASTGTRLWKQSISRTEHMMVSGNMLYVRDDVENLFAIKTSTGQVLWERIQCVDAHDIGAPEPHTRNRSLVWCTWSTDRLKNGLAAPTALAAGD